MDNRPIGVFDSGLGGLTAVRRLAELMPNEHIIYFGDTGRVPYGTRSRETIRRYAAQDVRFLRTFDLKAIVIACGTVSSIALDTLAQSQQVPLFGVVEPTARRAAQTTQSGRIGIIATPATIRTGAYEAVITRRNPCSTSPAPCSSRWWKTAAPPPETWSLKPWPPNTWLPCAAPAWTPWCWAAPTTRSSPR